MLNEKKYVKVSVCKSNIKKEGTYYGRVSKNGKISEKDLINIVKQKAPCVDVHNLELALGVLSEAIVECVESGFDVDLFGLGTVGLKGKGSIKVNKAMARYLDGVFDARDKRAGNATTTEGMVANIEEMPEDEKAIASDNAETDTTEGSYEKELTQIAKKSVEFAVQFSPSRQVKKHIAKYVEPAFITAKMQKPKIESVEKVCSGAGGKTASVIKIKGDGLKIVGEGATLYIKTSNGLIKVPKDAVLQNEPKTLMVLVNAPLKDGEKYSLGIATKYAKMGCRQTSVIRRCIKEFKFEKLDRKLGTLKAKKIS